MAIAIKLNKRKRTTQGEYDLSPSSPGRQQEMIVEEEDLKETNRDQTNYNLCIESP